MTKDCLKNLWGEELYPIIHNSKNGKEKRRQAIYSCNDVYGNYHSANGYNLIDNNDIGKHMKIIRKLIFWLIIILDLLRISSY